MNQIRALSCVAYLLFARTLTGCRFGIETGIDNSDVIGTWEAGGIPRRTPPFLTPHPTLGPCVAFLLALRITRLF